MSFSEIIIYCLITCFTFLIVFQNTQEAFLNCCWSNTLPANVTLELEFLGELKQQKTVF